MRSSRITVGTAGHVDHGKTLLTAALTGIDTDRLPEEKRRGMTIVPGFVPLDLPSGRRLGLIDVPGHERFVKNMLAGVAGVDMALLVVAADEGVMPQTVEHLNILHLLGVSRGVVAITKADLADGDWLALVREEVAALLAPTSLRGAPILAVSAVTGWHIGELKELLDQAAAGVPERPAGGLCRLPVDRVFTKPGFGTVVTGTLWSGRMVREQQLDLIPSEIPLRVRGLQSHGEAVEEALAGQRTAVNLAGSGADQVRPGCWLAQPGLLRESHRLDVSLELLPGASPLAQRTRLRVFHGTREVLGRVRLLDREVLEPGGSCLCQLELESPLPPLRGDRLILRACSPAVTIAGATVLDPAPPRYKRSAPGTMDALRRKASLDGDAVLLTLLEGTDAPRSLSDLAGAAGLSPEEAAPAAEALVHTGRAVLLTVDGAPQYRAAARAEEQQDLTLALLEEYHRTYPLRRGMPAAELRQRVFPAFSSRQYSALLESCAAQGLLVSLPSSLVARKGFLPAPTPRQRSDLEALERAFQGERLFTPPDWEELTAALGVSPAQAAEYLGWLLDGGRLARIGGLLYAAQAEEEALALLRAHFTVFTMAEARDLLGSSRRYVLPLLERFDARGITLREGDRRRFLR